MKTILTVIGIIIIVILTACASTNNSQTVAWRILERRTGHQLATEYPAIAEHTRALAENVLTAVDTGQAAKEFGNALMNLTPIINDQLLVEDIIDLSGLFLSDDYSFGDSYFDTLKTIVDGYLMGIDIA